MITIEVTIKRKNKSDIVCVLSKTQSNDLMHSNRLLFSFLRTNIPDLSKVLLKGQSTTIKHGDSIGVYCYTQKHAEIFFKELRQ